MSNIIQYSCSGSFDKTKNFLKDFFELAKIRFLLNEYGSKIVDELSAATPVRTGETAGSWSYEIVQNDKSITLNIKNSKMGDDGKTPVAILIQMGHGTRTGGYVPPIDYINPVVEPLFSELEEKLLGR